VNFTESPLYFLIKPLHIPYLALSDRPLPSPTLETLSDITTSLPSSPFIPVRHDSPSLPSSSAPARVEGTVVRPSHNDTRKEKSARYTTYPYEYMLTVNVQPVVPLPVEFGVTAMFNDNGGIVHKMKMVPFNLKIQDIFLPVYVEKKTSRSREVYVSQLFETFWTHLENTTDADTKLGNSFASIPNSETELHAKSIKHLEYPKQTVINIINQSMKPFIVSPSTNLAKSVSTNWSEVKIFIFLPRKYHLLMKMNVDDDHTNVTILTDYWRILTFLDGYFENIFNVEK